jgi:tetratricopeptide (TPR) repeat protein
MLLNQAQNAMDGGEFQEAKELLNRSLASTKNKNLLADLYLMRGQCGFELGFPDDAIDDLTESIKLSPDKPSAYVEMGRIYILLEDYALALRPLTDALRLDPKNYWALYGRAIIQKVNSDSDGALKDLRQASELSLAAGDGDAYQQIQLQIQRVTTGKWLLEEAKKLLPGVAKKLLPG